MSWTPIGRAPAQPNCDAPIILANDLSGRLLTKRCGATRVDKCKPCSVTYRRRVRRVADSGRVMRLPGDAVAMLTLTAPSEVDQHCTVHRRCDGRGEGCRVCACTPSGGVHLGGWNGDASARLNRFIGELRRIMGVMVDYFRGAEVQKRGALHFHLLLRFPSERGGAISLPRLRSLAIKHGFGHEVDLQGVSDERAAGYVAKYVAKSCADRYSMPWVHRLTGVVSNGHGRYRVWTSSRRWGLKMADVRAAQALWWQQQKGQAGSKPAGGGPAPAGPLDPNSQSYASTSPPPSDGGCP